MFNVKKQWFERKIFIYDIYYEENYALSEK